jgi:hypothetical protein
MKKGKFKIGWQKYEDVMENQLSSSLLTNIMKHFIMQHAEYEDVNDEEYEIAEEKQGVSIPSIVPISQELIEEMTVLSNFDCWMGHTNFDITPQIKDKLNKIPGIEVLKICSRYRFFIGVGSMFNFSDVRTTIEKDILPKGD